MPGVGSFSRRTNSAYRFTQTFPCVDLRGNMRPLPSLRPRGRANSTCVAPTRGTRGTRSKTDCLRIATGNRENSLTDMVQYGNSPRNKTFFPGNESVLPSCSVGRWLRSDRRHRGSKRFVTMIISSDWVTNWRSKVVYDPGVLETLGKK